MLKQMTLKHISPLLIILATAIFFGSCDNDNTVNLYEASRDARIYSITLKGPEKTAVDSALKKVSFAIHDNTIYNPDSIRFQTKIGKLKADLRFGSQSPMGVKLTYKDDFVVDNKMDSVWNTSDSVDFSRFDGFIVTPANGDISIQKTYKIEFRIHQIDPDTILWTQFDATTYDADRQRTVAKDGLFYCYSLKGPSMRLGTFDAISTKWTNKSLLGLPLNVRLESITILNNTFYAASKDGGVYSSTDGIDWDQINTSVYTVHNILGILPGASESENEILTVVEFEGEKRFASTKNLKDLGILKVNGSSGPQNDVPKNFLSHAFSSVTDAGKSLIITGGRDFNNGLKNTTWTMSRKKDVLHILETNQHQSNNIFDPNEDIATFIYDKKLYAVNDSVFAISDGMGLKWRVAPKKQAFAPKMPKTLGQSVIVDEKNYIWMFGGISGQKIEVWRGRLNKLNPKK